MSNDGLRLVIERRGRHYYFSFTDLGQLHESKRGYNSITIAGQEAEQYIRMMKLGRYWKSRRDKAAADATR